MAREDKEKQVRELTEIFKRAKAVYLTDFKGLDVNRTTELRKRFREQAVEYRVVKNTLAQLAAKNAGYDMLLEYLTGPTGMAFGITDPIVPARILSEFAKDETVKLLVKVGLVEGTMFDPAAVRRLASLPPRDVLISQVLAGLQAPIAGFVGVLGGILQKFVGTVDAIAKQKEGAA
jgi:large subunit ribosomal protein L10